MTDPVAHGHLCHAIEELPEQQYLRAFVSVLHAMWKMQRRHHWHGGAVDEFGVNGWGYGTPLAEVYRCLRDRARREARAQCRPTIAA